MNKNWQYLLLYLRKTGSMKKNNKESLSLNGVFEFSVKSNGPLIFFYNSNVDHMFAKQKKLTFMKNLYGRNKILTYFFLITITFFSCKKNNLFTDQNTFRNPDKNLKIAQEIPPEILNSMYQDYLKNNEIQKAKNIQSAYDFKTGKRIAESSLSLNLNVPGVGYVLDSGYFVESSGLAQAHVEKLGWVTYNFADMNSPFAPNAFDNTAPSNGQYMGTIGQSKRIEAFTLPSVRYNFNGSLS
ncbi:MAG: hypothetical protein ACTHK0_13970, partial [Ginsengibacter sp.]